jgi:hypothetical protein
VGYGDIHPHSSAATVAVSCQIASGPLLLSWLLATFLSASTSTRPRGFERRYRAHKNNPAIGRLSNPQLLSKTPDDDRTRIREKRICSAARRLFRGKSRR